VLPLRLHDRVVKTALRKSRLVDPWFVGKYSFSPYQACAHGCAYCDGRAERYWVNGEFDRDIVVRRNAAEVLAREAAKLRERGIVFVGSGISDAYQPPEASERLMPACGRGLADHRLPATILTKSSLIARDLDLWAELDAAAGFVLMMSLVTLDDALRRLEAPHRRYREWLLSRKDTLARRRSLREPDVTAELTALAASDEWPAWLGSDKLAAFLREVIVDRRVFDERTRRLREP
jgi:DNA repair photolyase